MSLISQALQKAQRERPTPAASSNQLPPAPQPQQRQSHGGLAIGAAIGAAMLIGLLVGLKVASTNRPPAPATQTAQPADKQPALIASNSTPSPALAAHEKTAPAQDAPAQPTAPSLPTGEPSPSTATDKTSTGADTQQAIVNWLRRAQINGVRLSEDGNKVLLNNQAYRAGDTIHTELGLKVLLIQQTRVLFIDRSGKKYMKRV